MSYIGEIGEEIKRMSHMAPFHPEITGFNLTAATPLLSTVISYLIIQKNVIVDMIKNEEK